MTESKVMDPRQEILASIARFAVTVARDEIDPKTITEDSTFVSLCLDSLDMVELSMELEDELEIDLRGVEPTWTTVKEAIDCLVALKAKDHSNV
jgi:acyl carrier protein